MVYYRTCFRKSPSIYRPAHFGCLPATLFTHPLHAFHWNLAQCASPQLPDRPSAINRCCTTHRSRLSAHQPHSSYQSGTRKIPFWEIIHYPLPLLLEGFSFSKRVSLLFFFRGKEEKEAKEEAKNVLARGPVGRL